MRLKLLLFHLANFHYCSCKHNVSAPPLISLFYILLPLLSARSPASKAFFRAKKVGLPPTSAMTHSPSKIASCHLFYSIFQGDSILCIKIYIMVITVMFRTNKIQTHQDRNHFLQPGPAWLFFVSITKLTRTLL